MDRDGSIGECGGTRVDFEGFRRMASRRRTGGYGFGKRCRVIRGLADSVLVGVTGSADVLRIEVLAGVGGSEGISYRVLAGPAGGGVLSNETGCRGGGYDGGLSGAG